MGSIDADAHVIETPHTFSYIEEKDQKHTPMVVTQTSGVTQLSADGANVAKEYWVVDNRVFAKDRNIGSNTTQEAREMSDLPGRLKHMDELEVDVQVLYPTLFLRPVTGNHQIEYILCRSYNRWLADIWKRSGEKRLRWVAMPPVKSMDKVRDEMKYCKDHGACGIFMRGLENEMQLSNGYFDPLFKVSAELDLPICLHSGNGSITHHDFFGDDGGFSKFKLAVVGDFHAILMNETPKRHPNVRWGFVEVSGQWIPYALNDLDLRLKNRGKRLGPNPLKNNNIFVACQVTDDLPYVLSSAGEDNLVIGTDYGHHDTATEIEALRLIKERGKLPAAVVDKILDGNARTLYGL
jgi:predicted TIM-barrel fold metal-dependent hydrolase